MGTKKRIRGRDRVGDSMYTDSATGASEYLDERALDERALDEEEERTIRQWLWL